MAARVVAWPNRMISGIETGTAVQRTPTRWGGAAEAVEARPQADPRPESPAPRSRCWTRACHEHGDAYCLPERTDSDIFHQIGTRLGHSSVPVNPLLGARMYFGKKRGDAVVPSARKLPVAAQASNPYSLTGSFDAVDPYRLACTRARPRRPVRSGVAGAHLGEHLQAQPRDPRCCGWSLWVLMRLR